MAINFPSSPSTGQIWSENGRSWYYDGTTWLSSIAQGPAISYLGKVVCTASQATVTFSNIPQTYNDLMIVYNGRDTGNVGLVGLLVKMNGDSTAANYANTQNQYGILTTSAADAYTSTTNGMLCGVMNGVLSNASSVSCGTIFIPNYAGTAFRKAIKAVSGGDYSSIASYDHFGIWKSTAAITSLTFTPTTSFVAGSTFTLYGLGGIQNIAAPGSVLLQQATASSSATLDFLLSSYSSLYDEFVFELVNIQPATSTANFLFRVGSGGTPTYETTNYNWSAFLASATGSVNAGSTSDSSIELGTSLGNAATDALVGRVTLYVPTSTTFHKRIVYQDFYHHSSGAYSTRTGGGSWASTTAVTAVRFLFSSGNIAAGTIRLYGLVK